MRPTRPPMLVLALFVCFVSLAASAGAKSPVVTDVEADQDSYPPTLTIRGFDFGAGEGEVFFGSGGHLASLDLVGPWSEDLLVVELPTTEPGTYLLAIEPDRGKQLALFHVALGDRGAEILAKLADVDGEGSGLDADSVDGVDSRAFQRRVAETCAVGSAIRGVGDEGSVVCEPDDDSLAALSCAEGQVAVREGVAWACADRGDEPWQREGGALYYDGGSVGIGTRSPRSTLEIARSEVPQDETDVPTLALSQPSDRANGALASATLSLYPENDLGARGGLSFSVQPAGEPEEHRMTFMFQDTVAIGLDPGRLRQPFHQSDPALLVSRDGDPRVLFGNAAGGPVSLIFAWDQASGPPNPVYAKIQGSAATGIEFFAGGLEAEGVRRMTITRQGRVGIGTAAPAETLEVVGRVAAAGFVGDGSALSGVEASSIDCSDCVTRTEIAPGAVGSRQLDRYTKSCESVTACLCDAPGELLAGGAECADTSTLRSSLPLADQGWRADCIRQFLAGPLGSLPILVELLVPPARIEVSCLRGLSATAGTS